MSYLLPQLAEADFCRIYVHSAPHAGKGQPFPLGFLSGTRQCTCHCLRVLLSLWLSPCLQWHFRWLCKSRVLHNLKQETALNAMLKNNWGNTKAWRERQTDAMLCMQNTAMRQNWSESKRTIHIKPKISVSILPSLTAWRDLENSIKMTKWLEILQTSCF